MNLNDYQTQARKTAIALTPEHMAFGLLEEAGEVAGVMKRFYRGDVEYLAAKVQDEKYWDSELSNFARDKLLAELGDVLWYVSMLADVVGWQLDFVASQNLAKLQRRRAKDMIHGSGDDR